MLVLLSAGLSSLTAAGFVAPGAAGLAVFIAFLAVLRPLAGETVLVLLSAGLSSLTTAGFVAPGAAGLAVFIAFLAVLRPLAGETVLVLLSAGLSSLTTAGFVALGAAGFDFSFLLLEELFPGTVLLTWGFSTLLAVGVFAVITAEDLLSTGFVTPAVFVVL